MACAEESELAAFVEGALAPEARAALEVKLDGCAHCRRRLGELARSGDGGRSRIQDTLTPSLVEPGSDPRVGTVIGGRYRIIRPLGSGGMGMVYEAEHTLIHRRFAVKVLHPHLATRSSVLQRFRNEARAAGAIGHPGIVRAFDVGRSDAGEPFLVLELLQGRDLETELVARAPLPIPRVMQIAMEMADALAAAHAANIIHRDLKPANVFLTEDGAVKIVDFGISKVRGELKTAPTTEAGMLLGTPAYMAPEQLQDAAAADVRSDIFALAAIAYRALTGQLLRPATNLADLFMKALSGPTPSLRSLRAEVPATLDALLTRCLHAEPEQRPGSMVELRDTFASMLATTGRTSVRPLGSTERRTVLVVAALGIVDAEWATARVEEAGGVALPGRDELFLSAFGEESWTGDLVARTGRLALTLAEEGAIAWVGSGALTGGNVELSEELDERLADRDVPAGAYVTPSLGHTRLPGLRIEPAAGHLRLVPGAHGPAALPLKGRRTEQTALDESLELALEERMAEVVVVEGPAGIGKSRLLEAMAAAARPAWHVRLACCEPRSSDFSLIRALAPEAPWAKASVGEIHGARLSADRQRVVALEALEQLASTGPLLLQVDDARWADLSSMAVLEELVRRAGSPVVVCFSRREPFEAGTWPGATTVRVRALRPHHTRALLGELVGEERSRALAEKVHRQTGGNPLFIEQIGLAVRDQHDTHLDLPLPPDVEGMMQARLDELPVELRELLKRAAVLAAPFGAEDLRALGVESVDVQDLDALVARGLLRRGTGEVTLPYAIGSPLIAEVASRMIDPTAREELHRRAAGVLEGRVDDEQIARHLEKGKQPAEAARRYGEAVARARRAGDVACVLRCADQAIALEPPGTLEVRMAFAEALEIRGRLSQQVEVLVETETLAEGARLAALQTERAVGLQRMGRSDEALPLFDRAIDTAEADGDPIVLARALGKHAVALTYAGRTEAASEKLRRAERLVLTRAPSLRAEAAIWRGQLAAVLGDLGEARNSYWAAVELYEELGDLRRAAEASVNLADFYNRIGATDEAIPALRAGLDACRRVGASRLMEGYACVNLGYAHLGEGDLDEAERALEEAAAIGHEVGETRLLLAVKVYQSRVAARRGHVGRARKLAAEAAAEAADRGTQSVEALARLASARASLAGGEPTAALAEARRALAIHDELGGMEEEAGTLFHVLGEALEASGDTAGAVRIRARGRATVEAAAARIGDRHWRDRFLADVEAHAALLQEAE